MSLNQSLTTLLPVLVTALPASYAYHLVLQLAKQLPVFPNQYTGIIGDGVAIAGGLVFVALNGPQTWQGYLTGAIAGLIVSLSSTGLWSRAKTVAATAPAHAPTYRTVINTWDGPQAPPTPTQPTSPSTPAPPAAPASPPTDTAS